jgi:hypothetical protein
MFFSSVIDPDPGIDFGLLDADPYPDPGGKKENMKKFNI